MQPRGTSGLRYRTADSNEPSRVAGGSRCDIGLLLSHGTQDALTRQKPRQIVAACNAPGGEFSMRVRSITTCALGLAAALSLANTLTAQTTDTTKLRTTRSDTRINISKGEVVAPRVDTVYVTRYDTVSNT